MLVRVSFINVWCATAETVNYRRQGYFASACLFVCLFAALTKSHEWLPYFYRAAPSGQEIIDYLFLSRPRPIFSASLVLTVTGLVNGKWQILIPQNLSTPPNRSPKLVTGDYVGDPYRYAKFGANPPTGIFCANGWNITIFYLYIPFSETPLEVRIRPIERF